MYKEKRANILLFCIIITISSGVLQYLNPDVNYFDYGLIIPVLLTVFIKNDLYTKIFGAVSVLSIIVFAFLNRDSAAGQQSITQHLFSIGIIVLTILAVLYVKKLYASIESDERQVNALFEHATEGIVLTNSKGEIVLINPAAAELFHYERDELLGKTIETLIPGRFHGNHASYREGFYKHPSNRTMGHGRDLFARTKAGGEFPVEVSLSFYNQKGESYVIAFVVDITARKKSEQELMNQKRQLELVTEDMKKLNTELETKVEQRTLILREALQELEKSQTELSETLNKEKELNEIKSRFVSMASHEFRTPLSTVISSASLISRYTTTEDQDKRDKHIKRIKDSVRHLNVLLEDFLSLGKLEEGKIRADVSEFDVPEFMEEVVDEMKSSLGDQYIIQTLIDGGQKFISDKRLLKNVLINLISNAAKFSGDDKTIWLNIHNDGDSMRLIVEDHGIGISEDDQQHLFTSFFRGKNVINIEGTGLGLHIVKRYIDLLHGRIELTSELAKGTKINIEVPKLEPEES
ncbi:MAG: PAS domain-containing sensor histidine kinase [Bacteroidetes bacterium]|nr:PAS domain-containing sensor histidine kinase [Bacteroidota bacterium]